MSIRSLCVNLDGCSIFLVKCHFHSYHVIAIRYGQIFQVVLLVDKLIDY